MKFSIFSLIALSFYEVVAGQDSNGLNLRGDATSKMNNDEENHVRGLHRTFDYFPYSLAEPVMRSDHQYCTGDCTSGYPPIWGAAVVGAYRSSNGGVPYKRVQINTMKRGIIPITAECAEACNNERPRCKGWEFRWDGKTPNNCELHEFCGTHVAQNVRNHISGMIDCWRPPR